MPRRLAAQRVGQQLMAVTDAEHRHAFGNPSGEPARSGFAPHLPVGDHGVRARDDGRGNFAGLRQRFTATRIDNPHRHVAEAGRNPALEIAPMGDEIGDEVAKLDDEQRLHSCFLRIG